MRGWFIQKRFQMNSYGVILTIACLLFVFLIPPFAAPDEGHHYFASYWLADCLTGDASITDSSVITMRQEDWSLYFELSATYIDADNYQTIIENWDFFAQDTSVRSVDISDLYSLSIGGDNITVKLPTVLALVIGKALGLGAYPLFYLGRIFAAIVFVACVVAATRITPVGKQAFIAVSLFPMTLQQAASYSYDSGIIAYSFLFLALVFRMLFGTERVRTRTVAAMGIVAILLAPCKVLYSIELLLIYMIPPQRFPSKGSRLACKIGVPAFGLLLILAMRLGFIWSLLGFAAVESGSTAASAPSFTLLGVITNPVETMGMFVATLLERADVYWEGLIGFALGWSQGDLLAPAFLMCAYTVLALYVVQASDAETARIPSWARAVFAVLSTLMVLAIMLTFLLDWTPFDSAFIEGVQGRYFLPFAPLLFLAFRSNRILVSGDTVSTAIQGFAILDMLYVIRFLAMALML